MRIGLVSQWYPPDYGGIAVYTHAMAHAYTDLGQCVSVFTAHTDNVTRATLDDDGVQLVPIDRWVEPHLLRRFPSFRGHVRSLRHLLYSYRVSHALRQHQKQGPLDVVECPEINAEGLLYALTPSHSPLVVRCHTPHVLLRETIPREEWPFNTALIERLETALIRRATLLTAPSQNLANRIEQSAGLSSGRVVVVPNGIDIDAFSPQVDDAGSNTGRAPSILYVGRLERHKGIQVLADALVQLAARDGSIPGGSGWTAVFAGPDRTDSFGRSNKLQLEQYFARHGLADRVEIRGFVDQQALIALYRSSTVCVVPSLLYESFSYTCLQAMACGKPVIATTSGGIPEVVAEGETGLLVAPGDSEGLGVALRRLLENGDLQQQMSRAARERAVRQYNHRVVAEQNLRLYAALPRVKSQ